MKAVYVRITDLQAQWIEAQGLDNNAAVIRLLIDNAIEHGLQVGKVVEP